MGPGEPSQPAMGPFGSGDGVMHHCGIWKPVWDIPSLFDTLEFLRPDDRLKIAAAFNDDMQLYPTEQTFCTLRCLTGSCLYSLVSLSGTNFDGIYFQITWMALTDHIIP